MFPLHQSNELRFQISPNPHRRHTISEDLILGHASLEDKKEIIIKSQRRRNSSSLPSLNSTDGHDQSSNIDNKNKKKMNHRDIERLRRQEMATLNASLRSLLPLQLIKGRRSISDHINESVRYIKHLQMKIKELGAKRDGLKKLSDSITTTAATYSHDGSGSSSGCSPAPAGRFLTVQRCCSGVEITVRTSNFGAEGTGFPLSRVLEVLLEEGLSLVSCVSTKVNGRFLHNIQSEASNIESINLSELEQKLNEVVPYSS